MTVWHTDKKREKKEKSSYLEGWKKGDVSWGKRDFFGDKLTSNSSNFYHPLYLKVKMYLSIKLA